MKKAILSASWSEVNINGKAEQQAGFFLKSKMKKPATKGGINDNMKGQFDNLKKAYNYIN